MAIIKPSKRRKKRWKEVEQIIEPKPQVMKRKLTKKELDKLQKGTAIWLLREEYAKAHKMASIILKEKEDDFIALLAKMIWMALNRKMKEAADTLWKIDKLEKNGIYSAIDNDSRLNDFKKYLLKNHNKKFKKGLEKDRKKREEK